MYIVIGMEDVCAFVRMYASSWYNWENMNRLYNETQEWKL